MSVVGGKEKNTCFHLLYIFNLVQVSENEMSFKVRQIRSPAGPHFPLSLES